MEKALWDQLLLWASPFIQQEATSSGDPERNLSPGPPTAHHGAPGTQRTGLTTRDRQAWRKLSIPPRPGIQEGFPEEGWVGIEGCWQSRGGRQRPRQWGHVGWLDCMNSLLWGLRSICQPVHNLWTKLGYSAERTLGSPNQESLRTTFPDLKPSDTGPLTSGDQVLPRIPHCHHSSRVLPRTRQEFPPLCGR